ncbi:unnamed protein product [Meganyctiphanes norvegica]|uniref:Oplophorus-luciferin 2-monooxygenase non-catalytic subunit n=1 Tax=Meganyctiphanes norvegica TaxID=48144 RepID=A0AAV2QE83_MEGNR
MKSPTIKLLYIVVWSVSGKLNDQNPITSDVYSQSKVRVMQDGHQDPIPSDVFNQSKVYVMQDGRHLPEYHGYERPCPDAEHIAPCVCTYDSVYNAMDLNCSAVESEEQLKQIFKADFPFKNFNHFDINLNNNIKVLEVGVFNGISFEIIHMSSNNLSVIESQAFNSCYETATEINLWENMITSFPFDDVSLFPKLSYFRLSINWFQSMIPADAFHGLTALEHLDLCCNFGDIVGTFQDLPSLQSIYLSYNSLTTIPAHFIKTGSSDLSYIILDHNDIVSVEPGAFDIVYGLAITMGYNSLSTLDEATWRPYLEVGGVLLAEANPLVCGCDIAWLYGEDQLLLQIGNDATCSDGENLRDLDPKIFDLC